MNSQSWRKELSAKELAAYEKLQEAQGTGDPDKIAAATRHLGKAMHAPDLDRSTGEAAEGSVLVSRNKNLVTHNEDYAQHQPGSINGDSTYRRVVPVNAEDQEDPHQEVANEASIREGEEVFEPRLHEPITSLNPNAAPEIRQQHQRMIEAIRDLGEWPANCLKCGKRLCGDAREPRATILLHDANGNDHAVVYCARCCESLKVQFKPSKHWTEGLTALELTIWKLWTEGLSQAQIASRLSNSKLSLRQQKVSRILAKIRAKREAAQPWRRPAKAAPAPTHISLQ